MNRLRADRDFEYVHLKDMRGAGTEPVMYFLATKYQDGLAYYESTKDTATHFFIDYLPKGTYVFEYDLKIFQVENTKVVWLRLNVCMLQSSMHTQEVML